MKYRFSRDDPEVRVLLGLRPHPTRCHCCRAPLLPVGTRVSIKLMVAQGQHVAEEKLRGTVATWARQDHWQVAVDTDDGAHRVFCRKDLRVLKKRL